MILKQFFDYYFAVVDEDVLRLYKDLVGREDLADAYTDLFSRNDEEAISFLLKFYRFTAQLRQTRPDQAILFNVHHNICGPFFIQYIWGVMDEKQKKQLSQKVGTTELTEIIRCLNEDLALRNWFRKEIGSLLSQEDLFTLNEVIALQNFSSGGEYSFLKYVYPCIQSRTGRVLDAGCGAGFATLVMSQYLEVHSVDACRARLERARALAEMMKKGEKQTFPGIIQLIEDELGGITVQCEFPSAEDLLAGTSREVVFTEGSIGDLPYGDNYFDTINCLDVLEHTYDPAQIIKEFARVIKPGGRVFVTAPTQYGEIEQRIYESIEGTLFPAMLHMHHFDPVSLTRLFAQNGFREVEVVPFDLMRWEEFIEIADRSPSLELAQELKSHPFEEVALQLFAVYEKI